MSTASAVPRQVPGAPSFVCGEPPGHSPASWLQRVKHAYNGLLSRCIILTGNIYDWVPARSGSAVTFTSLEDAMRKSLILEKPLGGSLTTSNSAEGQLPRFIWVTLRSDGIRFAEQVDLIELRSVTQAPDGAPSLVRGQLAALLDQAEVEASSGFAAISILGGLLRLVARLRAAGVAVRPLAVVVDHADALLPDGDMARLAQLDRDVFKYVFDLLRDEEVWRNGNGPDVLFLLSPTISDLNRRLLSLPKTVHVEVPLPDEATRRQFIESRAANSGVTWAYPADTDAVDAVSRDSSGLRLRALDDLLTAAARERLPLGRASVVQQVNGQLQHQLGNIVQVVYPDHTLADVIGFERLKQRLRRLAQRIDDPGLAPAGITVVGPNGAGKTFILEAFAGETGRAVISIAQIRSEWYGKTDTFAELFRSTISSFARILVLVDEAHVAFGSIHRQTTHETEARLTRGFITMMDDENLRSRVFWVLITTRPDMLDPDLVRRGRCSLFVPIFDPEGADAEAFLAWTFQRAEQHGLQLHPRERTLIRKKAAGKLASSSRVQRDGHAPDPADSRPFSAGDYREFIQDLVEERRFNPDASLTEFIHRWTPSAVSLADERNFQTDLAALRCDWPELMPLRYRDVPRSAIKAAIDQARGR